MELVDEDVHVARRVRIALVADGEAHELGVTSTMMIGVRSWWDASRTKSR